MANQSSGNSDSHGREQPASEDSSFVGKLPDGNLLSQILQFSGKELDDEEHVRQIESNLQPVAERYDSGQQLDESITRELVSALIPDIEGLAPPLSEELVEWVARTLFTDPASHGRLERMWVRLVGRVADGEQ